MITLNRQESSFVKLLELETIFNCFLTKFSSNLLTLYVVKIVGLWLKLTVYCGNLSE